MDTAQKLSDLLMAGNRNTDRWGGLDPFLMPGDPEYGKQLDQSSSLCHDCFNLDLENSPGAVLTTINGVQRRQATIEVSFGIYEPHTKNCGYCAMIRCAIKACVPGYTGRPNAFLHLAAITMIRDEPLLLTIEDWASTGERARFGVEVYRDSHVTIPSLSWLGAGSSIKNDKTSKDSWLPFAAECLRECDEEHSACRKPVGKLPTRVLDLSAAHSPDNPDWEADLRLTLTEADCKDRYVALSHCWGPNGIDFKLKASSCEAFQERIVFAELPATHRDAVVATRKLGIRYLWIDSLCIIQDSEADLQRETAVMGDIYSNAYLTIAAVSSSTSKISFLNSQSPAITVVRFRGPRTPGVFRSLLDSMSGFSRQKHVYLYARRTQRSAPPADNSASSSAQAGVSDAVLGPLSKRAWTLQERALASRVVHFTAEGLRFECPSHFKTEDGRMSTPGYLSRWQYLEALQASPSTAPQRARDELQKFWRRMLKDYAQRAISRRADLLPALSGFAAHMQKMHGAEYLAGLWRDRLIEDLCWTVQGVKHLYYEALPVRVEEAGVPSWSWVSVQSPTSYPVIDEQGTFVSHCEVIHGRTNLVGSQWNRFGQVSEGELVLRGPVRKAKLKLYGRGSNTIEFGLGADSKLQADTKLMCYESESGGPTEKYWRRAIEGEESVGGEAEVLCLKLGTWNPNYTTTNLTSVVLGFVMVLGRSSRVEGAFQRLGLLEESYGANKFDDIEGTVGLMRKADDFLARTAMITGINPSETRSASGEAWLNRLKEKPAYPAAQIMEVRIL